MDRFALNINITGINDKYTVDFDFVNDDDLDINVSTESDSLEEALTTVYNETLDQIAQLEKQTDEKEDMTDAEYISYLENQVLDLQQELKEKQTKPVEQPKYKNKVFYKNISNNNDLWKKLLKMYGLEDFF